MEKPDWSEFWSLRLLNQKPIIDYINWLEEEVKTLTHKLEKSEHRRLKNDYNYSRSNKESKRFTKNNI